MQTLLATPALPAAVTGRIGVAWLEAERGRVGLWLAPLMAAGAAGELAAAAEPPPWLWPLTALALLAVAVALRRARLARVPACAAFALALGAASAQLATWRASALLDVPRRAVVVTGVVQTVEPLPLGFRVTIGHPALRLPGATADAPPAARAVRIHLRGSDPLLPSTGDILRVRALLSPPSPPSVPGGWDLRRDAFFGEIGAYGFAIGPAERLGRAPGRLGDLLQGLREGIVARIGAVLPPTEAAITATLLTGSPSAIAPEDKAAFRDSGLAHLLAIAGLHIGIVMGLAFGTVRLALAACEWTALRWPTKAIAAIAAVSVGGGYMLLTGAHVPIVRSFAMACLVTLAVLTGRRALSLRALALAMAAIVLLSPAQVPGVSFQMSFSAVLALITGFDALRPWLRRLRGDGSWGRHALGYVTALALTSALAGTASSPYAAYHFGRIQLYYVLANLLAVPLTALWVMPLGLLALLLMPLGIESAALIPMGWGEDAILWIGRHVSALPAAVLAVPPMPPWGIVTLSVGLAWLGIWRTRLRLLGLAPIVVGLISPLFLRPPDVLVSADARLIGVHLPAGPFVEAQLGASAFIRDAWQQSWAEGPVRDLGVGYGFDCDGARCLVGAPSPVWIARAPPGIAACGAALIVSAEPVRLNCPAGPPIIDRFSVWREGAHAVWFEPGGPRIVTARVLGGLRPWSPAPRPARAAPGLPMAPADPAPD